jgi:hypothetical protein
VLLINWKWAVACSLDICSVSEYLSGWYIKLSHLNRSEAIARALRPNAFNESVLFLPTLSML